LVLLASLTLVGSLPADSQPREGRLFVTSFMTMHDAFFVDLANGIKKAVEAHGDRSILLDGEHSTQKQLKDLEAIFKQNPAAIFLIPATHDAEPLFAAAKAAQVPVILVDTDLGNPDGTLCQVNTDNLSAGRMACAELARVNPNAKVGMLSFSLSKGCIDRVEGFKQEMARHPGMTFVGSQDGHANKDGVKGVINDFLTTHPDMDAVFAINDVSAIQGIAGIEAAGRAGKITMQGVAGSREGAQAIKDGKMLSSCAQLPDEIGRVAVENAYAALAGQKVEKNIIVPVKLVTRANADQFLR
jgi:ribose transport system substrate-binding protein